MSSTFICHLHPHISKKEHKPPLFFLAIFKIFIDQLTAVFSAIHFDLVFLPPPISAEKQYPRKCKKLGRCK